MLRLEAEGGNLQKNGSKRGLIGNYLGYAPFSPPSPVVGVVLEAHPTRHPSPGLAVQKSGRSKSSVRPCSAPHLGGPISKALVLNPLSVRSLWPRGQETLHLRTPAPPHPRRGRGALRPDPGVRGPAPLCAGAPSPRSAFRRPCVPLATRYASAGSSRRAMCFGKAGELGCDEQSRVAGRRRSGEADAGWGGGADEVRPLHEVRPGFCSRSGPGGLGLPAAHAPPERSLRPRAFPYVEFLLFLDLQSRWLTTPLE